MGARRYLSPVHRADDRPGGHGRPGLEGPATVIGGTALLFPGHRGGGRLPGAVGHLGHDRSLVLIGILGIKVRVYVMLVLGIYINDQKVDSIKDSSSLSGTIGIVSADNTHITFDYFRVWTLK